MTNYFSNTEVNILGNAELREPQIFAYSKALEYYINNKDSKDREIVIVLPTGTGKTGLMAILPYKIAQKRVLIITPQLTIKNGILKNLTVGPENFYLKFNIIEHPMYLPKISEYRKDLSVKVYEDSEIVVANIHKLQQRLTKSLLKRVSPDFFDLIIIDEAHHSAAKSWIEAVKYFKDAKVIKVTGTPFRADGESITGTEIYSYPLSSAMVNKYVKSLRNLTHIPEELFLTIDGNKEKLYSINEIRDMKLKDEDWISRSVAYSTECSEQVVIRSLELLNKKKKNSDIPHKIIAVACSVAHAEDIKNLYEKHGVKSTIVHSKLEDKELEGNFKDIENNRVDVVINVAMLGEGYDHKYLSIAAIFRPFKNLGAYVQFVGRILRYISESNNSNDNIGEIIAHQALNLEELWEYYKKEVEKSNISKKMSEIYTDVAQYYEVPHKKEIIRTKNTGIVTEIGKGYIKESTYISTEILKDAEEKNNKDRENIEQLMKLFNLNEETARDMWEAKKRKEDFEKYNLNRPDLIILNEKQMFDQKIKQEIIPDLLMKTNHNIEEKTIANSNIFKYNNKHKWIIEKYDNNGAILALYINCELIEKIGKRREEWDNKDFENATKYLEQLAIYLSKSL